MTEHFNATQSGTNTPGQGWSGMDAVIALAARWRTLVVAPLAIGLSALGYTYLVDPTFTAKTTFIPPQQQQNAAASALASLGAAAALAGNAAGLRSPADQYLGFLQSTTINNRIIERFKLRESYGKEFLVDTRKVLESRVQFSLAKKEGLISIEVDDHDPQRAADMANAYVVELRRLGTELVLTEAQQRRAFFESQLKQTRDKLIAAQVALQGSGLTAGAIKSEPKAAAESYSKLRAEVTAAEVRLQAMRGYLNESATEFRQAELALSALRSQLHKTEVNTPPSSDSADYISKYRDFKYYEALFDLFGRQYELARVDESREGAVIQVVDIATKPERKSKPKRALTAILSTAITLILLCCYFVGRAAWAQSELDPNVAAQRRKLRSALSRA